MQVCAWSPLRYQRERSRSLSSVEADSVSASSRIRRASDRKRGASGGRPGGESERLKMMAILASRNDSGRSIDNHSDRARKRSRGKAYVHL